jgi:hypothetical protein|tara:strand:- start:409 stop:1656 length:1248 start_codon:yes stop_codon:yes gene_type:complete
MKNFKTYKDFKVDESVTRSKEKFNVIVKNTGEIIDDGLPKGLALKLAAKKNGWVIKKVDKSVTEKFMDSQIDQIAQKEFGMDYDQLGKGEKEWVRDEIDNMTESVTEAKAEPIVDLLDQGKWANVGMGEKKLVKLSDAFDAIGDEQADAIASHLNMAIELMQEREKKSAVPHMNKFNKACEQELKLMKKQGLAESVNEADINKLHKPFVDDIYKAVGVIDKILSKNKPPKVPKDIWSKLYGLAGDITDKADELLTLKESLNEAKKDLKVGDTGIDYNDNVVEVIEIGKFDKVAKSFKKQMKADAEDYGYEKSAGDFYLTKNIEATEGNVGDLAIYPVKYDMSTYWGLDPIKESLVTEAAPRITNSKETDALRDLRDMVANSSKGSSSRYSKEFDKAKTKALRAIEQMLTYTKIGA